MNDTVAAPGGLTRRTLVMSVMAAAIVVATAVLFQGPADAAAVVGGSAAQIGNFICAILTSIAAAFANSPFFSFLGGIFNSLLAAFGCAISGA